MFQQDTCARSSDHGHAEFTNARLVALLEMAAEAEALRRLPQSEHLFKRALLVARTTYGAYWPQSIAILWDLTRVSEKQGDNLRATAYYRRATALGSYCHTHVQSHAA